MAEGTGSDAKAPATAAVKKAVRQRKPRSSASNGEAGKVDAIKTLAGAEKFILVVGAEEGVRVFMNWL
jgi:hypothetical protein